MLHHVHTQNGLAESLIKRLQLIARPLLMRTKLPVSIWGHAILHAATLVCIRPTSYHEFSHLQWFLVMSQIFPILEFLVARYTF
uniref:Putative ovule protein n=1 Tax=Solanum chacoense TaxID=4108 RepID=A0A0V0H273_SOLCH